MPDRYEILDEIGSGGQAIVYRARDQRLGREVAIKLPPPEINFHDTEARHGFEREAKMLARLDAHPAVVHVYDFGIEEDRPFVVMRHVEGEDLKDYLKRRGPLGPEETAQLGQRLASALSHVHGEGVLHRDLKPRNVLLGDGQLEKAMLVDFGIAYLLERTTTAPREGTAAYMSPEQLNGDPLDERSDIYGLGSMLYECASGHPPYGRGEIYQVVTRMVRRERESLQEAAEVPSWLAEVVERCLSKEPEDRYGSAVAVEEVLQRGEEGSPLGLLHVERPSGEESPPPKPSPDSAHMLSESTVVNGRYRVDKVLGAGAFGITYRATDTSLSSTVVVKELYPEEYRLVREGAGISVPSSKQDKHQDLVERVLKEGRLLQTLDDPHLMSVYGAFEAHNTAYLVVEHLDGASLRERLDEKGTLSETEVWDLIEEVGAGLSALHEEGALHLDIKPDNIVKASGRYVVIDYGSGRMSREEESIELTAGGFTPEYAAIEQRDDSFEKGPYTDLYALGVTAYECLTGERPPRSAARLMREDRSLTWPDGIDTNLKGALEEVLQIEPEDRPESVEAWLSEPSTVEMPAKDTDAPKPPMPSEAEMEAWSPALNPLRKALEESEYVMSLRLNGGHSDEDELEALPESIGRLRQLESLEVGSNRLTSLPESIAQLKELKRLGLGGNELKSVPEWIGHLNKLKRLDLGYNNLTSLPESIGRLNYLKILNLGYNNLISVPEFIFELESLKRLYLRSNKIKKLPQKIVQISDLVLDVRENPLTNRTRHQLLSLQLPESKVKL